MLKKREMLPFMERLFIFHVSQPIMISEEHPTPLGGYGLRESNVVGNGGVLTIFIDNLPLSITNLWLRHLFKNDGDVVDVFVPNKIRYGKNFCFGFVRFKHKQEVENTIWRNNSLEVKGRKIIV